MSLENDRDRVSRDRTEGTLPDDRTRTVPGDAPSYPVGTAQPSLGSRRAADDAEVEASRARAARDDARAAGHEVLAREKQAFGGIKWGSAFFGWLTAIGTAVLLTALVAGTGTALGLAADTNADEALDGAAQNVDTVGIIGAVLLAIIVFVAYYAGGYVAGRMARLDGAKQGVAVWVWALVIAVIVAVVGALGGADLNVLASVNGFPRLLIGEGELTTIGIVTAVVALLVSLLGAVIGGLAGMRFHRKVDRAGLGTDRL